MPVEERRDPLANLSAAIDPRQHLVSRLAILGIDLDAQAGVMLGVQRVPSGVIVASTAAGAIDSREGGLAPGDIIYAVNTKPVASLAELRAALDAAEAGRPGRPATRAAGLADVSGVQRGIATRRFLNFS